MRIGVDFDGVLSNMSQQKREYARRFWGVNLTPAFCTTSKAQAVVQSMTSGFGENFIKKHKWDGGAEYTHLVRLLEAGPAILDGYPEPNCAECLSALMREGHKIVIITTLEPENSKWAKAFLRKYDIPYNHLVCVPYKKGNPEEKDEKYMKKYTKKSVMGTLNIDALIDDTYSNLELLSGFKRRGILLYFFTQPWNRDVKVKHKDIIRVADWSDVLNRIREYSNEKIPV